MMNRFAALLFVAVSAQALPLRAEDASHAAQTPNAQAQSAASQVQNGAADSDATGAIDKGAPSGVTVSPVEPGRAAQGSPQGKPVTSYEEAFRNWRSCAVMHQGVGNPPPQCEPLRAALRKAISVRPRGFETVDARPRS